jgi:hypothetical protein
MVDAPEDWEQTNQTSRDDPLYVIKSERGAGKKS